MKDFLAWLAIVIAILLPVNAAAVPQASDSAGTTVTLYRTVCVNAVVAKAAGEANVLLLEMGEKPIAGMLQADVLFAGKVYDACWFRKDQLVIVVSDEQDGTANAFPIPVAHFKNVEGI